MTSKYVGMSSGSSACDPIDEYYEHADSDDDAILDVLGTAQPATTPRPMYTRVYLGRTYVQEVLEGHDQRAYNFFRMSAVVFQRLVALLHGRGALQDTRNMVVAEAVAMFLRILAHNDSYRSVCELFQHSAETVSRKFREVLQAVVGLAADFIVQPTANTQCSSQVRNSPNFYPFFKDALGAIDGTHIPAIVARDDQYRYRNRKGFTSQNVLAAVNFERQFVFVATGWEGSASDSRVLRWAVESSQLRVPRGKYYLVDSGYPNTDKFIAPIRGWRYHLASYRGRENRQYQHRQEIYNHRHAQLRNVVERTFGIVKARFKILVTMRQFDLDVQADIILACCVLHNFITTNCTEDIYMTMADENPATDTVDDEDDVVEEEYAATLGDRNAGEDIRATILFQLLQAYDRNRR